MGEEKRFLKGLFKDSGHIDQLKGSWRHALNMIMNDKEGSLSNEGGTSEKGGIAWRKQDLLSRGQDNKVIGVIEVPGDKVVIFCVKNGTNGLNSIGLWGDGVYEDLYIPTASNADLNFSINNPIEGTFKVDSKGDLIIYWTDDLNPPRAFNITRQQRTVPNYLQRFKLYNITPSTSHKDHISLLNLFPSAGPVPRIELDNIYTAVRPYQKSIIEGGGLRTGVYYLALAYVDEDLVSTNYLSVSNPVSIVEEYDHTRPTTKKDGAKDGTQTSKAIKWLVSNLNTDYTRLRPTIIRKMGDEIKAIQLNDVEITVASNVEVVFSGVEGAAAGDLEDVIIDTVAYDTAKTINQLDGVLYVGNTTGTKDVGYQKYANNIKLSSVSHAIPNFDEFYATVDNLETGFQGFPVDKFQNADQIVDQSASYRYVPNIYKYKGYMRSEVYAFYIAFVLNDGSMSYGYHIPGREEQLTSSTKKETASPQGFDTASDFKNLSNGYAKNFHFFEYSFTDGSFWETFDTRAMNYWENATEFYPNSEDFEVWSHTGKVGSIKGGNVRHHHFPSNENSSRKSIETDHGCLTTASEGTSGSVIPAWSGNVVVLDNYSGGQHTHYACCTSWTTNTFTSGWSGNNSAMESALYNFSNNTFTADQAMDVTVSYRMIHIQDVSNDPDDDVCTKIKVVKNGVTSYISENCDEPNIFWTGCGQNGWWDWIGRNEHSGATVSLNAGDTIKLISQKRTSADSGMYQASAQHYNDNCAHSTYKRSYMQFTVVSSASVIPSDIFNDAKISHTVNRLGFTLDDIKIPREIADKVQGFRIYYAKRKHSDRTILGQAPIIPMIPKRTTLGICKEAAGDSQAMQILSTTQDEPENFYSAYPWIHNVWHYDTVEKHLREGGTHDGQLMNTSVNNKLYAWTSFTFHDFYLLRTKNSLAGATHISLEYHVKNLVWNGPSLDQDKRMQTKLVKDKNTDPEILMPREEWGWDATTNCYAQKIYSSIHIGMFYRTGYRNMESGVSTGSYRWPRLLGQKSKSYLKGDSIFNGKSLGFGGKILNLYGESSIIFKLKDNHSIDPSGYVNSPGWRSTIDTPMYPTGSLTSTQTVTNALPASTYKSPANGGKNSWGDFGHNQSIAPSLLINASDNAGGAPIGNKSTYAIANLQAFKTDVYKSIDSQELIWTGFEVLGADLENFIFDSDGPITASNSQVADFSIATVQGPNWQNLDTINTGIYGGDTYLCRYGVVTTLTGSDIKSDSNPRKAIHYHIVESTDNINFRHIESDNSLYFPATPAKDVLRNAGIVDFTDQENLKYNANYSELNDMRVAFPLPLSETKQLDFPTRVHRSVKTDTSSLIDNYRVFLANQFKDLPKNRGDLWKIAGFNNLLYFHMEESLLKSQGKQSMQMKDGSEAYVGSGDIFKQEPAEVVLTDDGYGGTQSQWSVLTTRFGYFFVDLSTKKVFLMKDKLMELSDLGMKKWFRDNLKFHLEDYGFKPFDNPVVGIGMLSVWDPKHRRILLTKRDLKPTAYLIDKLDYTSMTMIPGDVRYNSTLQIFERWKICQATSFPPPPCDNWIEIDYKDPTYFTESGWTISYYPELNVWVSLHSYVPYMYFNTSTNFYSLTDKHPVVDGIMSPGSTSALAGTRYGNASIWEHNSNMRGRLYQGVSTLFDDVITYHPFEIEIIHNELRNVSSLYSSFAYTIDVFNTFGVRVLEHGFTSYFMYNTFQLSGTELSTPLEYLVNTRRVGNNWKVNNFRDLAALQLSTGNYYMSTNPNVINKLNTGTVTSSNTQTMFINTGIVNYPNPAYLDFNKPWNQQKKFIDKWIGIRLIYDNISNNLLNLYSTTVESRNMTR